MDNGLEPLLVDSLSIPEVQWLATKGRRFFGATDDAAHIETSP